jgi:hypothetical protein
VPSDWKPPPRAPWRPAARSYKHVESILKHGLDRLAPPTPPAPTPAAAPVVHEHLRGKDYYH